MISEKISKLLYNLQKKFPYLLRVWIEITGQCNLSCLHCYMDATETNFGSDLTYDELIKFADSLTKISKWIEIVFTWGEPLMRKDFNKILKYYYELGFRCYMVTNGTLLIKSRFEEIKKYISWIDISIDWLKDYHDWFRQKSCFDIVIDNIKYINNNWDKTIWIKTVITKENINSLDKVYEIITSLWIKNWHIIPVTAKWRWKQLTWLLDNKDYIYLDNFVKNNSQIKIVFDNPLKLSSKKCMCWIDNFSIQYNWDIIACLNADRETVKKYWNIKKDDIEYIWNNSFLDYRNKYFYNCNSELWKNL